MTNKIIAVDFDGTLCKNNYPDIGEPNTKLINYLKTIKEDGNKLILWTCRKNEKLTDAVKWCKEKGLIFDAVNENLQESIKFFDGDSRKIFADIYIDDKSHKDIDELLIGGNQYICQTGIRPCFVKGRHGYFHMWEHYSTPMDASPLVGGHPAGIFSKVFGVVEISGRVRRVDPEDICF